MTKEELKEALKEVLSTYGCEMIVIAERDDYLATAAVSRVIGRVAFTLEHVTLTTNPTKMVFYNYHPGFDSGLIILNNILKLTESR